MPGWLELPNTAPVKLLKQFSNSGAEAKGQLLPGVVFAKGCEFEVWVRFRCVVGGGFPVENEMGWGGLGLVTGKRTGKSMHTRVCRNYPLANCLLPIFGHFTVLGQDATPSPQLT